MNNVIAAYSTVDHRSLNRLGAKEYKSIMENNTITQFEKQFKGMYKEITMVRSLINNDEIDVVYLTMTEPTGELIKMISNEQRVNS